MLYYSPTAKGFFDSGIHTAIPDDAVEITPETHSALLTAQAQGQVIQAGADGLPVAADPPALTTEQLAAAIRSKRDALLTVCDWTQLSDAPLTAEVKTTWATYRQALRDITAQAEFPASVTWPTEPDA